MGGRQGSDGNNDSRGVGFMERENLQHPAVNRDHEPDGHSGGPAM